MKENSEMLHRITVLACVVWLGSSVVAVGRTWTDSTGNYRVEADMIGYNDTHVVLKKKSRQLVAVPIEKLSKEDRDYLESKEAVGQAQKSAETMQTWTMASGLKVIGRVVDFGRRNVTIQRKYGAIYVNDRQLKNWPEICQKMLPKIVSHFEKTEIDDAQALNAWAAKLGGKERTFTCEGVLLQLENGDIYGVPFFLLADEDKKILEPGWKRWLAADKDRAKQEHESFLAQSQAQAYQQDQRTNQQIAMMQLQMQGYEAGLFDLWEVCLYPGRGVNSPPLVVVVPGRDSRSAAAKAMQLNPGFTAGAVAKVRRK
jgi:hypothetical protein